MSHPPIDVVALDCSPTSNRLCISCISTSFPRSACWFLGLVGCGQHIYLTSQTQVLIHWVCFLVHTLFQTKLDNNICLQNNSYLPLKYLIFASQVSHICQANKRWRTLITMAMGSAWVPLWKEDRHCCNPCKVTCSIALQLWNLCWHCTKPQ